MPFLKARRGSTVVMVAILLVAFAGVGAIAADVGRFQVVAAEVQSAADAAALDGALILQRSTATAPSSEVKDSVVSFVATTNKADNRSLSVVRDSVKPGYWTPATKTFDPASAKRPNAVYVRLNANPTGFFSKLIGQVTPVALSRYAIAWIANLPSNCVRPMAFPYTVLYRRVSGDPTAPTPSPDLDPAKFAQFEALPDANRMFIINGPNSPTPWPQPNDGSWTGFSFVGNAGKAGFEAGVAGCNSPKLDPDAANGVTLPGNNDYASWADNVIQGGTQGNNTYPGICKFKSATNAGCYLTAADSIAGVTINSAWGDLLANGSNGIDFRYVGEFQLLCWFRGGTSEVCPAISPGGPYPNGTMVGYLKRMKPRIITPDDVLSNDLSNVQKIILVK